MPLHPSTISALRAYAGLRDTHFPTPSTPAFFPSARGRRMGRAELNATFTSPIAYTVGGVFLLVIGYTFSLTLFFTKIANLTYIFHQM